MTNEYYVMLPPHELQTRYSFKDFEVWDIKGYNL